MALCLELTNSLIPFSLINRLFSFDQIVHLLYFIGIRSWRIGSRLDLLLESKSLQKWEFFDPKLFDFDPVDEVVSDNQLQSIPRLIEDEYTSLVGQLTNSFTSTFGKTAPLREFIPKTLPELQNNLETFKKNKFQILMIIYSPLEFSTRTLLKIIQIN
ncbi:hypothetical protein GEMRC1_003963 [Eukaryota sp. GEM-RC1]